MFVCFCFCFLFFKLAMRFATVNLFEFNFDDTSRHFLTSISNDGQLFYEYINTVPS